MYGTLKCRLNNFFFVLDGENYAVSKFLDTGRLLTEVPFVYFAPTVQSMSLDEYFMTHLSIRTQKLSPCINCGILINQTSDNIAYSDVRDSLPEEFFPKKTLLFPHQCFTYRPWRSRLSLDVASSPSLSVLGLTLILQQISSDESELTCYLQLRNRNFSRNLATLDLSLNPIPFGLLSLDRLQQKIISLQ